MEQSNQFHAPAALPYRKLPATHRKAGWAEGDLHQNSRNENIFWRLLEVKPRIPVASRYTVVCFAITKDLAND
jgi:hypothetical protein